MMKNPHVQRLPDAISGLEELEDLLSEPTPGVVRSMGDLEGDIIILGAGGKIGPSLARGYPRVPLARRIVKVGSEAGLRRRASPAGRHAQRGAIAANYRKSVDEP